MLFLMLVRLLLDNSMVMLSRSGGAVHVALWFSIGFLGFERRVWRLSSCLELMRCRPPTDAQVRFFVQRRRRACGAAAAGAGHCAAGG